MLSIDHVQLAAPPQCEGRAREYFGDLLGLVEKPKQGATASSGGVWFRTGNLELHIGVQAEFNPAKKAHVGFSVLTVADLNALSDRLRAHNHAVRWDTRLPGVARFFTEDPWGNRLEFCTPLPAETLSEG